MAMIELRWVFRFNVIIFVLRLFFFLGNALHMCIRQRGGTGALRSNRGVEAVNQFSAASESLASAGRKKYLFCFLLHACAYQGVTLINGDGFVTGLSFDRGARCPRRGHCGAHFATMSLVERSTCCSRNCPVCKMLLQF